MEPDRPQQPGRARAEEYRPGLTAQIPTFDLNVEEFIPVISPRQIKQQLQATSRAHATIVRSRQVVKQVLTGSDSRMLIIVGPCSIHDEAAAVEYARKLAELSEKVSDCFYLLMRVYFEKPRTTVGWKGLINDPHLDGSFDLETGVRKARSLLIRITEMNLATATEFLDPITPQYLADLITWSAIGARTTESQTHRQMASGLSMPVGFKNGTGGNMQVAVDAIRACKSPHNFLGINDDGQTAIIRTLGNKYSHMILRGGTGQPNYDPETVAEAQKMLAAAGQADKLIIDCSHDNSGKKFQNQPDALFSVLKQRAAGNDALVGCMLESNLFEGNQKLTRDPAELKYGVSITDECLGWQQTEQILLQGREILLGK
ncbi:MAG: 3-deoxy-7-phosphoheptulonate synthase [Phycisphaerae bacterium]